MRDHILRPLPEADLRVYVVWLPVLSWMSPEAFSGAVESRATRVEDSRVEHYLNPDGEAGSAYGRLLGLPDGEPAWDAYLVFGAQARWDEAPPAPAFWMHQLGGGPPELRLDSARLAEVVRSLLAESDERGTAPAGPHGEGGRPFFDLLGSPAGSGETFGAAE